jgi:hypothetical protein
MLYTEPARSGGLPASIIVSRSDSDRCREFGWSARANVSAHARAPDEVRASRDAGTLRATTWDGRRRATRAEQLKELRSGLRHREGGAASARRAARRVSTSLGVLAMGTFGDRIDQARRSAGRARAIAQMSPITPSCRPEVALVSHKPSLPGRRQAQVVRISDSLRQQSADCHTTSNERQDAQPGR